MYNDRQELMRKLITEIKFKFWINFICCEISGISTPKARSLSIEHVAMHFLQHILEIVCTNSVHASLITTAFAVRHLCVEGDLTALQRRLHCALFRTPNNGVCFVHTESTSRRSAFALTGDATALLQQCFWARNARTSAFLDVVRSPWDWDIFKIWLVIWGNIFFIKFCL